MIAILVVALMMPQAPADTAAALDATRVTVSAPKKVAEVDAGTAKGDVVGLAWSGDGAILYLRSAEYDRWRNERAHHFLFDAASGKMSVVEAIPSWVSSYWMWKSGYVAPGVPEMKLDTETQSQMVTAVGTVRDGGLSQSRADPTQPQIASDYASAQQVATVTLRLKGTVVIESVNKSVQPGAMWGWAPSPIGGLAYVDAKKRLILIDRNGRTFEVPGTSDVMLPAWSPDGKRIAFVRRADKKKYVISVVEVAVR